MRKTGIAVALVLAAASSAIAGQKNISSLQARTLLAKTKNVFLLDVRTPEEYRQAHLKGAVLIPLGEIEHRLKELPRNRTIVVYCAVGSRSTLVAGFLAGKGYGEVYNVSDGIVGWYRNGLPIER